MDSDEAGQYGHSLIIGYNPKNGNYQIGFHDGFVDTSHPASLNQWTHTVVLFDSNISFFADGIKKFEQIYQKGNLNGTNFRIGRHSGPISGFYAGLIDGPCLIRRRSAGSLQPWAVIKLDCKTSYGWVSG